MRRNRRLPLFAALVTLTAVAVTLAAATALATPTPFDEDGVYSPLPGASATQTLPISSADLTPSCTDAELAQLGPGEVLWHFVLNGTAADSGKLRADFQSAGLTFPDVDSSANPGPTLHWNVITPSADTVLNFSSDAAGDGQFNVSHVCYRLAQQPLISTDSSGAGVTGDALSDTAHLTGGTDDISGTITFTLYGPDDDDCSDAIYTEDVDVSGNGDYSTDGDGTPLGGNIAQTAGTYQWIAEFKSDDTTKNLDAGPTACNDPREASVVEAEAPVIVTEIHLGKFADETTPTVVGGAVHVALGSFVHDSATADGGPSTPEGTVYFKFYSTIDCTDEGVDAGSAAVDTNGVAHPSDDEGALAPGSYGFNTEFKSDDTDKWADSNGTCEPLTVDKGNLDIITYIHDEEHGVVTEVPLGSTVHDTAAISGAVDGFPVDTDKVGFAFWNTIDCTGDGTLKSNTGDDDDSGDPRSEDVGPLGAGSYSFRARFAGDDYYNAVPGGEVDCEPLTVNKGDLDIVTFIHNADHGVITFAPNGAIVHDTAQITGAVDGFPVGTVGFAFYNTIDCTGEGQLVGNAGLDSSSGDQRSNDVGPLSSGAYSFRARLAESDNYDAVPGSEVTCEPLSIRTFGKTMGFWGNNNGQARLLAQNAFSAANAVTLGIKLADPNASTRCWVKVDSQAKSKTILPNTTNGLTLIPQCDTSGERDSGINANSFNVLLAQTLALSYNIKYVSGFDGQPIISMGCTPVGTLDNTSDVGDALDYANYLIGNSIKNNGSDVITQAQIGAMNTLLGCMNAEA